MTKADDKIVQEAQSRFRRCEEYESTARQNWLEDVKFANGDDINGWQWDSAVLDDRLGTNDPTATARPCLTVNKTRQHCLLIVNDARQNKAQMKFSPTGGGATYEAAQIYSGIGRRIEYQSQATAAYDKATWDQVQGGIGYWRVVTRYAGDDTMDQDLFIERVADALSVYLDPDIQAYDGSDAKFGFVSDKKLTEDAEKEYPELKGSASKKTLGDEESTWQGADYTRLVEYYRVKESADRLHVLPDGSTMRESDAKDAGDALATMMPAPALDGDDAPEVDEQPDPVSILRQVSVRSRAIKSSKVEWFKIVGDRIVERHDTVFETIPIVRVVGEETCIEGRLDRRGHVRAMRDVQRMYNYWTSAAVEFVALQGKSPYIAAAQSIEGYETYWENANTENYSYLPYNHVGENGQELPRPERAQPPVMAQAFVQGMTLSDQQMMQVTGQYPSELGRPGNETSGVAIQQRQRQGDTATYHYIDHLAQAIRYTGRLILQAVPKVYDTQRIIKIMALDGTQSDVHVDPTIPDAHSVQPDPKPEQPDPTGQMPSPQEQAAESVKTLFNPGIGQYEVEADVGPSFGTQRQEAFNAFTQIVSQNKELIQVAGDLMFKNADFPGADEMAERLKRGVPQQYLGGAPDPQVTDLQQKLQLAMQHAGGMAKDADEQVSDLKRQLQMAQDALKAKDTALDLERYKAETARIAAVGGIDPAAMIPIIRQMVSEVLQTPAVPVIQAHQTEDAMHQAALDRARAFQDASTQAQHPLPPQPEPVE